MKTTESKGKWADLFDQAIEAYLADGLDPSALPGTLAVALGTCPAIESRRRAVAMLGEGLASTVQAYISGGVNTSSGAPPPLPHEIFHDWVSHERVAAWFKAYQEEFGPAYDAWSFVDFVIAQLLGLQLVKREELARYRAPGVISLGGGRHAFQAIPATHPTDGVSPDGLTEWWVGEADDDFGQFSVVQCSDGRRLTVTHEAPAEHERFLFTAPGARVLMNEAELDALLESLLAFFGLLRSSREKAATAEVKGEA